jgi:hypothetical protein
MENWTVMGKKQKRAELTEVTANKKVKSSGARPLDLLTINYTGVRSGETLLGVNPNQSLGVEMQVRLPRLQLYHPLAKPDDAAVRDRFNALPFFSDLSYAQRQAWLDMNVGAYATRNRENHLCDEVNAGLCVRFLRLECPHWTERLGGEGVERLIAGCPEDQDGYWPIGDVYELLRPPNKQTKATHHNLIFRPENWALKSTLRGPTEFDGAVVLTVQPDGVAVEYENAEPLQLPAESSLCFKTQQSQESIAVRFQMPRQPIDEEALLPLVESALTPEEYAQFQDIATLIKPFTPSVYKSLLQKLVRTRCGSVSHAGREYSARAFLLCTLTKLALHPGAFNPNTQRFITGLESCTKRLAVCVMEDSWCERKRDLTLLLCDALVKKYDRAWSPPLNHFAAYFRVALEALESRRCLRYSTELDYGLDSFAAKRKSRSKLGYVLNYVLLKEVGSMKGDLAFFSHIAKTGPQLREEDDLPAQRYCMPLIHCIDQHCYSGLAHYMPYFARADRDAVELGDAAYLATLDKKREPGPAAAPFQPLFARVWKDVSSRNGRRHADAMLSGEWELRRFTQQVRFAQQCVFEQKFAPKQSLPAGEMAAEIFVTHQISEAWLPGLVGPIQVGLRDGTDVMVVLRCDNIEEMLVVRKPGGRTAAAKQPRNIGSSEDISARQKEIAIETAKGLLRHGYPLKHLPPTLEREFGGASVWLEEDPETGRYRYTLELPNSEQPDVRLPWEQAVNLTTRLEQSVFAAPEPWDHRAWCERALRYRGPQTWIDGAEEQLSRVLALYKPGVLKRLCMYLAHCRPLVRLYDIARDGSSSKLDVAYEDIAVHHLLCAIAALYPAALELQTDGFHVLNGPLFWTVRDGIKQFLAAREAGADVQLVESRGWARIAGDASAPLMAHQQDSLDEMCRKREAGKRGHAIFIDVGLGKTAIGMEYLAWLVAHDRMPPYCVYTAPPAAIVNAEAEFTRYGIPFSRVVVRKGAKHEDGELQQYRINILEHDQMRRPGIYRQLKRHACRMLFIVDEFHLTTAPNTIRSSIALEISRLSDDFIAMTGTIVRNESVAELLPWLEQIVEFYVNHHNYMVAFGALISRKANTGVVVQSRRVEAPFTPEEHAAYYGLVPPKLGGTAQQCQFQRALAVCYGAMSREMVRLVLEYVEQKRELVFVLARDVAHQEFLAQHICVGSHGRVREDEIFLIGQGEGRSLTLRPEDDTRLKVIITTLRHTMGYTLTRCRVSVTGVYPSNQATRTQFEGRTNRLGQLSKQIEIVTVHCGVLTYMLECYARAQSFAAAIKEFATYIELEEQELVQLM